jgi:hypothetical protein
MGERAGRREAARGLCELAKDTTLALRPGPGGLRVRSHRGTMLVTQAGDPLDHVLEEGGMAELGRRGLVVVWALSDAVVAVEGRGRTAPGSRLPPRPAVRDGAPPLAAISRGDAASKRSHDCN